MSAPAAIINAINDALAPFDAQVTSVPVTPMEIMTKIQTIKGG